MNRDVLAPERLRHAGIASVGVERMTHIMMHAELDGIVCSGPRRGKQFTYALLDARAPRARMLDKDEALAGMGNALTSVIVLDGQFIGTWKRRLAAAAGRYGEFLGLPVTVR